MLGGRLFHARATVKSPACMRDQAGLSAWSALRTCHHTGASINEKTLLTERTNTISSATAEIARLQSLCPSRSFNVNDFDINRKLVCEFLRVANNNNLTAHCFQVTTDYWSKFLFNTFVRDEPLNSRHRNLPSRNYRNIAVSHGLKRISMFWTIYAWYTSVTDGQTDRWPLAIVRSNIVSCALKLTRLSHNAYKKRWQLAPRCLWKPPANRSGLSSGDRLGGPNAPSASQTSAQQTRCSVSKRDQLKRRQGLKIEAKFHTFTLQNLGASWAKCPSDFFVPGTNSDDGGRSAVWESPGDKIKGQQQNKRVLTTVGRPNNSWHQRANSTQHIVVAYVSTVSRRRPRQPAIV